MVVHPGTWAVEAGGFILLKPEASLVYLMSARPARAPQ